MIIKQEMLLTDKKIFGDKKEHEYTVTCYDGWAVAVPTYYEKDEHPNSPKKLYLSYPKVSSLSYDAKRDCLDYRGIYDLPASRCNCSDVCMLFGTLRKTPVKK